MGDNKEEKRGWTPNEKYNPHPLDKPGHDISATGAGASFWLWLLTSLTILILYVGWTLGGFK